MILTVLLVATGVGLILYFIRPRAHAVFVIQILDGNITLKKGKAPGGFIGEAQAIVEGQGLREGEISGVRRGASISLQFSEEIPEDSRQPFRNVWVIHRPPEHYGGGEVA